MRPLFWKLSRQNEQNWRAFAIRCRASATKKTDCLTAGKAFCLASISAGQVAELALRQWR
jgi:hypothetical protein